MKSLFIVLIMSVAGFSANAVGQKCAPGYSTPSSIRGMCHLYKNASTCLRMQCEWVTYSQCSPGPQTDSRVAPFCKHYTKPNSCVSMGCEWRY